MFSARLLFCGLWTTVVQAGAIIHVAQDENPDRSRTMWQDADGRSRMCSEPSSDYERVYCTCEKFRDAVFGCKTDEERSDACLPRQLALAECQARGLHMTLSPNNLTVRAATDAKSAGITDTHTAATASPLNYSSRAAMPLEPASSGSDLAPSSSSPQTVDYLLGGLTLAAFIVLVVVLVRRCRQKRRRHGVGTLGAGTKMEMTTRSRSSTVSSASARGTLSSLSEAEIARLLAPECRAEETHISEGGEVNVAAGSSSTSESPAHAGSLGPTVHLPNVPMNLHELESGDLGNSDLLATSGPGGDADKGNCKGISSESYKDRDSLTIENEAVAAVDASSGFSRPITDSSLTEPLGPRAN